MAPTQLGRDSILRRILELPDEQKARLLEEMSQHELGSSAANNRPFLEKLDEALTRLEARIQSRATEPESAAIVQNSGSRQRPDPALAMEWLRLHSKDYGGELVALDGGRLIEICRLNRSALVDFRRRLLRLVEVLLSHRRITY
jgi:hypothetical protein